LVSREIGCHQRLRHHLGLRGRRRLALDRSGNAVHRHPRPRHRDHHLLRYNDSMARGGSRSHDQHLGLGSSHCPDAIHLLGAGPHGVLDLVGPNHAPEIGRSVTNSYVDPRLCLPLRAGNFLRQSSFQLNPTLVRAALYSLPACAARAPSHSSSLPKAVLGQFTSQDLGGLRVCPG
jgi:hypothetical protein